MLLISEIMLLNDIDLNIVERSLYHSFITLISGEHSIHSNTVINHHHVTIITPLRSNIDFPKYTHTINLI